MSRSTDADAIVLGAGAAGLTAAAALARAGRSVLVLEARGRIGGRIHTLRDPACAWPIELGAEFMHGDHPALRAIVDQAGIARREVPPRHDRAPGLASPPARLQSRLDELLATVAPKSPDRPFAALVADWRRSGRISAESEQGILSYVSGFHAADPSRLGVQALREAEQASDEDGDAQYRFDDGYAALLRVMRAEAEVGGVILELETVVERIEWRPGAVLIRGRRRGQPVELTTAQAVITLPLGVLKAPPDAPGAIAIGPDVPSWRSAMEHLEMGSAERVVLRYDRAWWAAGGAMPVFLHGAGESFPVWWTAAPTRAPLLTGWIGGTRAATLGGRSGDEIAERAIASAATVFGRPRTEIVRGLQAVYHHDWSADPFSRGAYSYGGVGASAARRILSQPAERTLVLAGEALAPPGRAGTVHGAIASAHDAVTSLLQAAR